MAPAHIKRRTRVSGHRLVASLFGMVRPPDTSFLWKELRYETRAPREEAVFLSDTSGYLDFGLWAML